jgi:hypothetical protein
MADWFLGTGLKEARRMDCRRSAIANKVRSGAMKKRHKDTDNFFLVTVG